MIIVAPAILIISLIRIQFIDNEMYQQKAINQQLRQTVITPQRGTIYDRNMKPLAQSANVWTIVPVSYTHLDVYKRQEEFKRCAAACRNMSHFFSKA